MIRPDILNLGSRMPHSFNKPWEIPDSMNMKNIATIYCSVYCRILAFEWSILEYNYLECFHFCIQRSVQCIQNKYVGIVKFCFPSIISFGLLIRQRKLEHSSLSLQLILQKYFWTIDSLAQGSRIIHSETDAVNPPIYTRTSHPYTLRNVYHIARRP